MTDEPTPLLDDDAVLALGRAATYKQIGQKLPEPLIHLMDLYAEEAGTTKAAILREAVACWLISAQMIASARPDAAPPNLVSATVLVAVLGLADDHAVVVPAHVQEFMRRVIHRAMNEDGAATAASQMFAAMQIDHERKTGAGVAAEIMSDDITEAFAEMLRGPADA